MRDIPSIPDRDAIDLSWNVEVSCMDATRGSAPTFPLCPWGRRGSGRGGGLLKFRDNGFEDSLSDCRRPRCSRSGSRDNRVRSARGCAPRQRRWNRHVVRRRSRSRACARVSRCPRHSSQLDVGAGPWSTDSSPSARATEPAQHRLLLCADVWRGVSWDERPSPPHPARYARHPLRPAGGEGNVATLGSASPYAIRRLPKE